MDQTYARAEFYWGRDPNDLCLRALACLPVGARDAVDLGCGEGRDVIAFARRGLRVVGVEVSEPGLAKLRRWAAAEGLEATVEAERGDVLGYRLVRPVDVVYSSGTLHYLPAALRGETFAHYKAQTRTGGIHAVNVFVEKPYLAVPPDWGPDEHFFRSGELLGHYWDWEILHHREFEFDCRSGGRPHRHAMTELVARRPAVSRAE